MKSAANAVNTANDTMSVELAEHGLFRANVERVRVAERQSKRWLASAIAATHEGDGELAGVGADKVSHWMHYPKAVLCVVWGELFRGDV